ncbi:hypothetical protein H1C71_027053, partial [Ictidomys tridecemlineatus]
GQLFTFQTFLEGTEEAGRKAIPSSPPQCQRYPVGMILGRHKGRWPWEPRQGPAPGGAHPGLGLPRQTPGAVSLHPATHSALLSQERTLPDQPPVWDAPS